MLNELSVSLFLISSLLCLSLAKLLDTEERFSYWKEEWYRWKPDGLGSKYEHELIYNLFEGPGYNPLIRPVQNISDSIAVKFGITLFQVITVEERTQVMKTNNWIRMMWTDYQLKWDPNDYGGIEAVRLPHEEVWKPDIVLLNNADGKYEPSFQCHIVVYSNGIVMWIPPSIYKSSCTIDVRYFPFDQQECNMKFGSWTFSGSQVKLEHLENNEKCDLSNYVPSGTWDLIGCPSDVKSEDGEKYSEINYNIILRRKTLFYTVNLLTPCVLISFLSVLTFYLPADAQEKVTLCISILLALVVFLLLVSKSLPPTSVTVPLISKYLFFTFIMNIVTVIVSVVIINLNFRSPRTYKMPRWMRIIFLNWLPIIMFMKRPDHDAKYKRWRERKLANKMAANATNGNLVSARDIEMDQMTKLSENKPDGDHIFSTFSGGTKPTKQPSFEYGSPIHVGPKVMKAAEAVEFITTHLKTIDDYEEICNDWKYVAGVIDRFLLYIFLGITICGTISIIVDAPHIFEVVDQKVIVDDIQGS